MVFIKKELAKNRYKYISLENIVLYAQSVAQDKPSLAETAKFLLRCYADADADDFPLFSKVDDKVFRQNITDNYIQVDENQVFYDFLTFVATFDNFEYGTTESGLKSFNSFTNYFLPIDAVNRFLSQNCGLKSLNDLPAFIRKLGTKSQMQNNENNNVGTPSIQTTAPNQQNQTAKIAELQAEITRLKAELAEYSLIKQHRERAPEFNALIETLIYYAKDYGSDAQPLKKRVKLTFNEKAKLSQENRRGEEVARILGLPE